jgi:hypothetical protein
MPRLPGGSPACVFDDLTQVGNVLARCSIHGRACKVPSVDILVATGSFKAVTNTSANDQKKGPWCLANAFVGHVDAHRPRVIIFENSDPLPPGDLGTSTQAVLFENQMASRGYEGQTLVLDACEFGSPKKGRSMYIVFVGSVANPVIDFRNRTIDDMFGTLKQLVNLCRRSATCCSELLLPPDHPAIETELNRRLEFGPRSFFKCQSISFITNALYLRACSPRRRVSNMCLCCPSPTKPSSPVRVSATG